MKDETAINIALDFLRLVIAGYIADAYEKYVDMNGKHHNVYFPAGFSVLQKAMEDNHAQFPNKILTTKNILADGNLAAVHSHVQMSSDDKGISVVHIFRFSNGKIIEMWDVGGSIPEDSPNLDGAF